MKKNTGRDYVRSMVRERDENTCQDCHQKWVEGERKFDVHHTKVCGQKSRKYDRVKDGLDGMVTLCHKCHFKRPEHKMNVAFYKRHFIVPKSEYVTIRVLRDEGWTLYAIGNKYGVSYEAIRQILLKV